MLRLMYDNIVIADRIGTEGSYAFQLRRGLKPFFVPNELFRNREIVPALDVIEWVEDRVFPRNRVDANKLLKGMGLEEYHPLRIAEQTKACLMEDGFWIAFTDEDNFREHTIRGEFGFPDLVPEQYLVHSEGSKAE